MAMKSLEVKVPEQVNPAARIPPGECSKCMLETNVRC